MKELFEQSYFTEMYDGSYDKRNPEYKFKSYLNHILKRIIYKSNLKLLDIGCAYGSFLKAAKENFSITGTDISEHAIEVAKSRLPNAEIYTSAVADIPLNNKFNVVTCFDILEHVPELDQALAHIQNLLEENGVLVLSVPVYDTFIGKLVFKLDKDPTHVHKNSRYWWLEKLEKAGYKIVSWNGIWRYYFKNIFYLHYISNLTRGFTPAIIIVVKKK